MNIFSQAGKTKRDVIVLYNTTSKDSRVDVSIPRENLQYIRDSLINTGYDATLVGIEDSIDSALEGFDPCRSVILNLCEGVGDNLDCYEVVPPILEKLGFIYTGSGSATLAADKPTIKSILRDNNIPTPPYRTYHNSKCSEWTLFPAIVKPACLHGSLGIDRESVVDSQISLMQRLEYVLDTYKAPAIVEQFIFGTEYSISVLGNWSPVILPACIVDHSSLSDYHDRIWCYDTKWNTASSKHNSVVFQCPIHLEPSLNERIVQAATAAYQVIGIKDYGRIDLRVQDGMPYVLDVNANPAIGRKIKDPLALSANVAGYDYRDLLSAIVEFAVARTN